MNEKIHIGNVIIQLLQEKERTIAWLAKKIPCDRSNLYRILQCSHIPGDILWRISKILDYDFYKHYSEWLKQNNEDNNKKT